MDGYRTRYEARMHKVLEHIDRRLDQPLTLGALADVAHFSPFHFHRLFTAWMGETLGDYLRRRRLELGAARLIAQPRLPVIQVALSVGFGSAEAFAHAFKARFECSPSAWRKQQNSKFNQAMRNVDQAQSINLLHHEASKHPDMEAIMKVKLIERKPATVAYLRHTGPYGEPVSRFWQEEVYPWMAMNNLLGKVRYGVSHDDPGITAPGQCRYDACVEVADDFVATGRAFKTTLAGGKYAVFDFKGSVAEVEQAWMHMLREWLPSSGYQLDARPFLEHYPETARYDPETGAFDCEICVPVAPV